MGTTFTTAHIHNKQNLTKAQFKKAFTDMMKAKGYTASDEDNAALTYTFVFTPDRKWVTVLTDGSDARREAAELAKGLKSYAIMIDLVDSDFAELSLFDEAGAHKDTLTLGNSYLEDAAPMGDPAAWQPLLSGSWEQMQEIQNGSYTFAEDALAQFAPLIGMDSGNILLDNDSAVNDNNAVVLHFKKAAEKKLTLNSAFVKVFGEALEPLGFVKAKSKYPYFVRNVGNELFHVISYYQINSNHPTIKEYVIVGGIASIYRKEFNLSISPKHNLDWLLCNLEVYNNLNPHNNDYEFRKSIYSFSCDIEDPNSVLNSFCNSFEITKNILLSEIDKAADIDSFIRYLHRMNIQTSYIDKETEYFDPVPISSYDEGMVYFFTKKYISLICDDFDRFLSDYKEQLKKNVQGYTIEEYNKRTKRVEQRKKIAEEKYQEVLSDADLFEKIMEEIRLRAEANLETLRNLGISEAAPSLNTDAAPAKEKKLTLNSAFVKYFGELLMPYGFVKKTINKLPMFIRVINNEILQIVTYRQVSSRKVGYSSFEIYSNIMTLYRKLPDLSTSIEHYLNRMHFSNNGVAVLGEELTKRAIEYNVKLFQNKEIIWNDIPEDDYEWYLEYELSRVGFHFSSDNHAGMIIAKDIAEKILLPAFECTKNIEQCIDYFYLQDELISFYDPDEELKVYNDTESFNPLPSDDTSEALTLIVAEYRKDITQYTEKHLKQRIADINGENGIRRGLEGAKDIDDYKARFRKRVQMETELRELILDTPKLKEKALIAAREIQQKNLDMLHSYNIV